MDGGPAVEVWRIGADINPAARLSVQRVDSCGETRMGYQAKHEGE